MKEARKSGDGASQKAEERREPREAFADAIEHFVEEQCRSEIAGRRDQVRREDHPKQLLMRQDVRRCGVAR